MENVGDIPERFEDIDFGGEEGFVYLAFEHFEIDNFDGDGLVYVDDMKYH